MKYETKVKWGKTLLAVGMALSILWLGSCNVPQAKAFSGDCAINALSKGRFLWKNFPGDTLGFGEARDYCLRAGGGVIDIGPGCEGKIFTWPSGAGLLILKHYSTGFTTDPPIFGGGGVGISDVVAMKYGDLVASDYAATQTGIQAALDYVGSSGGIVILGAGTFTTTSALWIHSNTHLMGQGKGITIIQRSSFNEAGAVDEGTILNSSKYGTIVGNKGLTGGVPTDSLSNISVSSLTLDGNYTAFPTANPNGPGGMGIQFWFVDGVNLLDLEVKNTLQTGIELDACRNSLISNFYIHDTGQQTNLGSRNGININNNSGNLNASINWARITNIEHGIIKDQRDAAIDFANNSEIIVDNVQMYNSRISNMEGNFSFEHEGDISNYLAHDFKISNITSIGLRGSFYRLAPSGGTNHNIENLNVDNFSAVFGINTTNNAGEALLLGRSNDFYVKHIKFSNGVMSNINAGASTSGALFCQLGNAGTIASEDITLSNLSFYGANGGVSNSSNGGVSVFGNIYKLNLENVHVAGCENVGFWFRHEVASGALRNVTVRGCSVDGAQSLGLLVGGGAVAGTTNGVRVFDFIAKDVMKNTLGHSIQIIGAVNGQIVKNVLISSAKLIRTSGTNMQGFRVFQSGTAVVDSIVSENNNFSGAVAPLYTTSGTPTNVIYNDPLFRSDLTSLNVSGDISLNGTTSKIIYNNNPGPAYLMVSSPVTNFRVNVQSNDITSTATDGFHISTGGLFSDGKTIVTDSLRVGGRVDLNNSVIQRQGADIASASNITLTTGTLYSITGNTTITGITVPVMPAGKHYIVTFIITTTVQFTDGGNLNLNGNFNGDAAGGADRLTVDCDGTNCNEIGRAIN